MKITKLQRSVLRSDLKPVTKLTLLALTNIVDWHTWTGQTSYEVLVVETGLSLASVKRGIADLCKKNHIHKKRNGDHNGYRRNQYTINTDSLFAYLSKWNPKSKEEKEDIVSNRAVEIAQIDTMTGSSRAVEMAQIDIGLGGGGAPRCPDPARQYAPGVQYLLGDVGAEEAHYLATAIHPLLQFGVQDGLGGFLERVQGLRLYCGFQFAPPFKVPPQAAQAQANGGSIVFLINILITSLLDSIFLSQC